MSKASEDFLAVLNTRSQDIFKRLVERFLELAATQQPALYGIACVLLAIGTGWLGGVVFRR